MKISLIIPAAGTGSRMKADKNKQYLELGGMPVLAHTIGRFHSIAEIEEVIIAAGKDELDFCRIHVAEKYGFTKVKKIVPGGATRQDSVFNALLEVSEDADFVIIHDGARPFLQEKRIRDFISALKDENALVMGVPEKNTLKKIKDSFIVNTIPRENVWEIQTPQGFRRTLILDAFKENMDNLHLFTDDSFLVEKLRIPVKIFQGDNLNIKITTPEDLKLGNAILSLLKEEVPKKVLEENQNEN